MHGLAPYRVAVVDNNHQTIRLWDETNTHGLATWMYETLLAALGGVVTHDELKRSRISKLCRNSTSELVCGAIQTGVNGYTSDLVDTETGKINHQRKVQEAEFISFFFLLISPVGCDFAILLLQRFGNLGAKDFLVAPLVEKFRAEQPGRYLRVNRLVPIDMAKQLLEEADIKTIRLIKYDDVDDVSSALGEGFSERTNSIEMVFKAKRNGILPTPPGLLEAIQGKKAIRSLFAVEGFDYDSIKVEVDLGGKRRIVDIRRPEFLSPNVDITEDVAIGIDGHPTWDSLMEIYVDFALKTLKSEGFEVELDTELEDVEEADNLPIAEDQAAA